ncbi:YbaB/EbfC family nucleoid-associated protein [Nocardia arizonensis]|uniref:YbaB/EbfC family nucleoid-associated protein n=1 Tax=Nocardia arizonensis TaxID=1141647 RepID=UPI0006CF667B|nr:YbaB/EbfC family nucleoid-associated protein [Nocardia arizonensis]
MGVDAAQDEIDRINKRLAELRGSARAVDGSVAIETDPSGRITHLYLADYAMDNGPDALASLITDRHRAAMNAVEAKVVDLFEALPPPEESVADRRSARESIVEDSGSGEFGYIPSHIRRG